MPAGSTLFHSWRETLARPPVGSKRTGNPLGLPNNRWRACARWLGQSHAHATNRVVSRPAQNAMRPRPRPAFPRMVRCNHRHLQGGIGSASAQCGVDPAKHTTVAHDKGQDSAGEQNANALGAMTPGSDANRSGRSLTKVQQVPDCSGRPQKKTQYAQRYYALKVASIVIKTNLFKKKVRIIRPLGKDFQTSVKATAQDRSPQIDRMVRLVFKDSPSHSEPWHEPIGW